ncbi:MAG: LysM peptidoglycan-binding domain-containing protein [Firmicutes bacterium]|nr:LysM peptidoglycan-binding domain-containing protein [Bacillota bacterium]
MRFRRTYAALAVTLVLTLVTVVTGPSKGAPQESPHLGTLSGLLPFGLDPASIAIPLEQDLLVPGALGGGAATEDPEDDAVAADAGAGLPQPEGDGAAGPPPAEVFPARVFSHTITEGETLWGIAQSYGINVNTIIGANPSVSPSRLQVGQVVKVLSVDGVLHEVRAGDTLSGLASRYKVDASKIIAANALTDPGFLKVGQQLIIPGATPLVSRSATSSSGKSLTVPGSYRWPVWGWGIVGRRVLVGVSAGFGGVVWGVGRNPAAKSPLPLMTICGVSILRRRLSL